MILGIGTDLCDITRIEKLMSRLGTKLVDKHFSSHEQGIFQTINEDNRPSYIAKRFAAKEAVAKALGCGIRGDVFLKDISISNDELGKPNVTLSNGALNYLKKITPDLYVTRIHISLSDDGRYASAYVMIEALKE